MHVTRWEKEEWYLRQAQELHDFRMCDRMKFKATVWQFEIYVYKILRQIYGDFELEMHKLKSLERIFLQNTFHFQDDLTNTNANIILIYNRFIRQSIRI